jgi:uncharacterized delta-60 repeat protein
MEVHMKASTALARSGSKSAPRAATFRQALLDRAMDEVRIVPRVWIETLEPRYLMDATAATVNLDPSFGQAGLAQPLPPNRTVLHSPYSHLTPSGDGKFYAITYGNWTFPPGYDSFELIRVNADGSLDPTFTPPHIENQTLMGTTWSNGQQILVDDSHLVGSVLVQPDGRVIVVARDVPYECLDPFLVMRFNTDGSPDQGFGQAGVDTLEVDPNTAGVPSAWLTADGKIDVMNVGYRTSGDSAKITLRQINADGTPDESFDAAGQVSISVPTDLAAYLLQSGSQDTGWTADLAGAAPLPDGGSVAYLENQARTGLSDAGLGTIHTEFLQLRLDSSGTVLTTQLLGTSDTPWASAGPQPNPPSVVLQPDGKPLILNSFAVSLQRFNVDGTPDTSFHANLQQLLPKGFGGGAQLLLPQADGTILLSVTDAMGFYGGLERLNSDGSLDTTFAGGQPIFGFSQGQSITAAMTLPDGSIVANVMTDATGYRNVYFTDISTSPSLAKLLPTGGIPNTFDIQAAEAAAQAAYDAAHPPYVPPTPDPGTPTDPGTPATTTDPTSGGSSQDGNTVTDPSSDPLGGAGLTAQTADSTSASTDANLFANAPGSTLFNPDGTPKVFDDGSGNV